MDFLKILDSLRDLSDFGLLLAMFLQAIFGLLTELNFLAFQNLLQGNS